MPGSSQAKAFTALLTTGYPAGDSHIAPAWHESVRGIFCAPFPACSGVVACRHALVLASGDCGFTGLHLPEQERNHETAHSSICMALHGGCSAAGLGVQTLAQSAAVGQAAGGGRPNIVVILSDDMGFSDLGCYGSEIQTPNLDRLAAGGLRFTQFYNTARCCPTRACLLSGLYPHQAAVGHMTEDKGLDGYQGDLSPHCVTIAQVLHEAGYATYAVGKWHVTRYDGPDGPKHNWPLQRGFDGYYGTIRGAGSYFDPGSLTRGNTMISPFADPEYRPERFYYTDAISDMAVRFIDQHEKSSIDRPFFMYVAYTAAHGRCIAGGRHRQVQRQVRRRPRTIRRALSAAQRRWASSARTVS